MDDLQIGGEVIDRTLLELETVNRRLGGNSLIRDGMERIYQNLKPNFPKAYFNNNPLRIADFGCGGGDLLRVVANWARQKKLPLEIHGFDANENIIRYAREKSKDYPEISLHCLDVTNKDFQRENFDIITCSFFCHHFSDEQLVLLLKQLYRQANHAILINDLHRHWIAYLSIRIITALFSKSYMVKNDAALSVARSFKRKELKTLLSCAGINNYELRWKWAFRYQIIIYENML